MWYYPGCGTYPGVAPTLVWTPPYPGVDPSLPSPGYTAPPPLHLGPCGVQRDVQRDVVVTVDVRVARTTVSGNATNGSPKVIHNYSRIIIIILELIMPGYAWDSGHVPVV